MIRLTQETSCSFLSVITQGMAAALDDALAPLRGQGGRKR
jgi:hypothetical protein